MSYTKELDALEQHYNNVSDNSIPPADNIGTLPKLTQEELESREIVRTSYIEECRNFLLTYIKQKAPARIKYNANIRNIKNCDVFSFAPPAPRGVETPFYSQVVFDVTTNQCKFARSRPTNHPVEHWYFPIYYMVNGFTKNAKRTFQALGLVPGQTYIRNMFERKGYTVVMVREFKKISIRVSWGDDDEEQ
tara:strand:- start:396 stop:968 length:573 start_codon:yes stop_codon:yes gene_type:complete